MAFRISITAEAESQLRRLPARQQRQLEAAVQAKLVHQPKTETRNIKKLRPNPLVQFELRAGDLRVLYNVEENEVTVLIVGRKIGNQLLVKGEVFHGHQDNSSKPAEGKSEGDVE